MAGMGWIHVGGLFRTGLVYEYEDETQRRIARAYVGGDEHGRATIVAFDLDAGAKTRRDELERALRRDLDVLAEGTIGPGGPSARVLAEWCAINPDDAIRSSHGPKAQRDDELARFAHDVIRDGLPAACKTWNRSRRRGRELMQDAQAKGLAIIEADSGYANRYLQPLARDDDGEHDRRGRFADGDGHRTARIKLDQTRRALQANWTRQAR